MRERGKLGKDSKEKITKKKKKHPHKNAQIILGKQGRTENKTVLPLNTYASEYFFVSKMFK